MSEYLNDHKIERTCLLIGRILALYGFTSFIILINFGPVPFDDFFVIGVLSFIPAIFLMSFTMSYAFTLRELKKGIKERRRNLLKSQELAKSSNNFSEFINKITLN